MLMLYKHGIGPISHPKKHTSVNEITSPFFRAFGLSFITSETLFLKWFLTPYFSGSDSVHKHPIHLLPPSNKITNHRSSFNLPMSIIWTSMRYVVLKICRSLCFLMKILSRARGVKWRSGCTERWGSSLAIGPSRTASKISLGSPILSGKFGKRHVMWPT